MHRALTLVLRYVDVRFFYIFADLFIVPVCLLINTNRSRTIIYAYFRRIHGLGVLKAAWNTYVNHCLFSGVVIDRFAMFAGAKFDVQVEGSEHVVRMNYRPERSVVLSSHVGCYELAGYTFVSKTKTINAITFAQEKESVMENRKRLFADTNARMIQPQADMSHLFLINEAFLTGQIVSIPADRFVGLNKAIEVSVLGRPASLPFGPFSLATSHGSEVLAINVMKTGTKQYTAYVTPLKYDTSAERREQARQLAEAYASQLTACLQKFPTQWYNYFDFWKS